MNAIARYATLTLRPFPNRTEHINYGLMVFDFGPHGIVASAHIAPVARKLRGFAPHIALDDLEASAKQMAAEVTARQFNSIEKAIDWLHAMNWLRDTSAQHLGGFRFATTEDHQKMVEVSIANLCTPPSPKGIHREQKSRLFIELKNQFKAAGILAPAGTQIPDHIVVQNYAPEPEADVRVEFAMQNTKLHIAQTIDLRTDSELTAQQKASALSKAFSLNYATQVLEPNRLTTWMICAGAKSKQTEKLTHALEKQAQHMVHWEDATEMEEFMSSWAAAAGKPLPTMPIH